MTANVSRYFILLLLGSVSKSGPILTGRNNLRETLLSAIPDRSGMAAHISKQYHETIGTFDGYVVTGPNNIKKLKAKWRFFTAWWSLPLEEINYVWRGPGF